MNAAGIGYSFQYRDPPEKSKPGERTHVALDGTPEEQIRREAFERGSDAERKRLFKHLHRLCVMELQERTGKIDSNASKDDLGNKAFRVGLLSGILMRAVERRGENPYELKTWNAIRRQTKGLNVGKEPMWPVDTRVCHPTFGDGIVLRDHATAVEAGFKQQDFWTTYIQLEQGQLRHDGSVLGTSDSTHWRVTAAPPVDMGGGMLDFGPPKRPIAAHDLLAHTAPDVKASIKEQANAILDENARTRLKQLRGVLRDATEAERGAARAMAETGFWENAAHAKNVVDQHRGASMARRDTQKKIDALMEEHPVLYGE